MTYLDKSLKERRMYYKHHGRQRETIWVTCAVCNIKIATVGMYKHLLFAHDMTIPKYIEMYGEYRKKYLDYQRRSTANNFECMACHNKFASAVHLGHHVSKSHNLTGKEYALQHVFGGSPPLCKCGCGESVEILKCYPYKRDYIWGHWPTPDLKKWITPAIRKVMSQKAIARVMKNKLAFQPISKSAALFLDGVEKKFGVKFEREFQLNTKFFDGKWKRCIIEVDGEYWHKGGNKRDLYKTRLAKKHGYSVYRFIVNREGEVADRLSQYDNRLQQIFGCRRKSNLLKG